MSFRFYESLNQSYPDFASSTAIFEQNYIANFVNLKDDSFFQDQLNFDSSQYSEFALTVTGTIDVPSATIISFFIKCSSATQTAKCRAYFDGSLLFESDLGNIRVRPEVGEVLPG